MNILPQLNKKKGMLSLCLAITLLVGCSKTEPGNESVKELPKEENTNTALFHKLTKVRNLPGSDKTDSSNEAVTIFYSLETNKAVNETHKMTRNWDVAFSNIFNSQLSGNNGSTKGNYGEGNPAVGGIMIVEKAFEEVTEVPADNLFKTTASAIEMDGNGKLGNGIGWLLYDFDGTKVFANSENRDHVAYALGNGLQLANGTTLKPRTLIVRTAKGNYAKIKPLSVYKDLLTADSWFKNSPQVFISFDYVLVPKGSKTFDIKP